MIYLDYAATSPVLPEAVTAAVSAMTSDFGNPSSGHMLGYKAREIVENAREVTARALGCFSSEIVFTSGGTEANSMVFAPHTRGHIVTTALEHASVRESAAACKSRGAAVTTVQPDTNGRIDPQCIAEALREDTALVSVILVCNETGAVNPVADICRGAHCASVYPLIHTDMVQGFCKIPVDVRAMGVDFATVSGHKIGAPKGIGALYVRKGVKLPPLLRGGGQENTMRPGTESVPLIAAFGAAIEKHSEMTADAQCTPLRDYALERLQEMPAVRIIPPHDAPHILSFALPPAPGAVAQRMLNDAGICVSTGSACSRGKKSTVLLAMKQPPDVVDSTLRISFGADSTREDIDALCAALAEIARRFL